MKAVVLMAYGTPRSMKDVEAYYTHIRGGRKPAPEELDNLIERYEAIGGTSPLIEITERERAGLESSLRAAGSRTKVYAAMKHSPPFVADVVREASEDGAEEVLALALAPHYSRMSVGSYISSVKDANEGLSRKMKLRFVESWHDNPVLIRVWSDRIRDAASKMAGSYWLVFSAHSLPERIISEGDPYKKQLLHTCGLIADEVGKKEWSFAFQSAGHTPEPWLGPDLVEHLESLRGNGETKFLVAPIGFVSDHLEILYDIDVECSKWARDSGVSLSRCRSLNDSKEFVACLFSIVKERGFL